PVSMNRRRKFPICSRPRYSALHELSPGNRSIASLRNVRSSGRTSPALSRSVARRTMRSASQEIMRLPPRPAQVAPVLDSDGPALVVAPASSDLQIARGKSLQAKPRALHELRGRDVRRLDVRLQAMEPEIGERMTKDQAESLGHVANAGVRLEPVIAEVAALEPASNDLV